jgi:nucleoid-associated protein YgaU
MALEKAVIDILDGTTVIDQIRVLFNPTDYSIERSNAYKATSIPGLSGPILQFINGEADVLSMELFLDDYTDRPTGGAKSTDGRLDDLARLLEIRSNIHAPPVVRFVWGRLSFKAVIEKMSRKMTLFHPNGIPARASVNVTFKEYRTLGELLREPRLESPDKSKRRVVVGVDTLWMMAWREFQDAAKWRVIAEANDLDDPRAIKPGDWLVVPPLEADRGTGRSR